MHGSIILVALLVTTYARAPEAASLPVVIDELNAAAAACGISKPQLEGVALRTLEASRYQPEADGDGQLNVRVTVTQSSRARCVANVSVKMKAYTHSAPAASGLQSTSRQHARAPNVVLCDKSGKYASSRDRFGLEIESAVEYSVRRCLASLK
jgi:hypothetical protein